MKTIFRKGNKRKWVTMDKGFLESPSLSLKAKGLMAYLLSLPDDWETHPTEIEKHSMDGITAIRAAFKELTDAKYIHYQVERDGKAQIIRGIYLVYETPHLGNLDLGNLDLGNLKQGNRTLLSTNGTK